MKKSRVNRLLAAGLSFAMAVAALPLGGVTVIAEETREAESQRTVVTSENIKNYLTYDPDDDIKEELVSRGQGDNRSWAVEQAFKITRGTALDFGEITFSYKQLGADGSETPVNEGEMFYAAKYNVYVSIEGENFTTDGEEVLAGTVELKRGQKNEIWWKEWRGVSEEPYTFDFNFKGAMAESPGTVFADIQGTARLSGEGSSLFTGTPTVRILEQKTYEDGQTEEYVAEVTLTPDTAAMEAFSGVEEFTLTMDFGESFADFDYTIELPIVITTKNGICFELAEDADEKWKNGNAQFLYGDTIKLPAVATYNWDEDNNCRGDLIEELENGNGDLTLNITKDFAPVTDVTGIKDSAYYRLEYIYETDDNYAVLTIDFNIERVEITEDNVNDYFTFTAPDLTWDGEWKGEEVRSALQPSGDDGITEDNYSLNWDGDMCSVGDYTLTLWVDSTNVYTGEDEPAFEVTIKKADFSVSDIIKKNYEWGFTTYGVVIEGECGLKDVFEYDESLPWEVWEAATFTAKQNGEVVDNPKNAGVYNIFLTLEGSDNFNGFDEQDSNYTLEITQRMLTETVFSKTYSKDEVEDFTGGSTEILVIDDEFRGEIDRAKQENETPKTNTVAISEGAVVESAELNVDTGMLSLTFKDSLDFTDEATKSDTLDITLEYANMIFYKSVVITVTSKKVADIALTIEGGQTWANGVVTKEYSGETVEPAYQITYDGAPVASGVIAYADGAYSADGLTVKSEALHDDGSSAPIKNFGEYRLAVTYDTDEYYGEAYLTCLINQKLIVIKGVDATVAGSDELLSFLEENIGEQIIANDGTGKGCSITEGAYVGSDERPTIRTWLEGDNAYYDYDSSPDDLRLAFGTYTIKVDFVYSNEGPSYGSENYALDLQDGTLIFKEKGTEADDPGNDDPGNDDPGKDPGTGDDPGKDPGTNPTPSNPGTTVTPPVTVTPPATTEPKDPDATVVVNPDGSK
ncbi:MAG: hypothetical protein NC355_09695, partial [Blautia sp.]|nr:hypothetical protein [Blautia sp.]